MAKKINKLKQNICISFAQLPNIIINNIRNIVMSKGRINSIDFMFLFFFVLKENYDSIKDHSELFFTNSLSLSLNLLISLECKPIVIVILEDLCSNVLYVIGGIVFFVLFLLRCKDSNYFGTS
jgi:hypothetical protein